MPKKGEEEEVHSVVEEKKEVVKEGEKKDDVLEKIGDVRKGRARGPQRRPPTVKPIIPAGWGISVISTVFQQPVRKATTEVKVREPAVESKRELESLGLSEGEALIGEMIIENENGVKSLFLEGGITPGGSGVEDVAVPMMVDVPEHRESTAKKVEELSNAVETEDVQHEEKVAATESQEREETEE